MSSAADNTPRPFRLNNPGDLRIGQPWLGLADPADMTPAQLTETAFCVFKTPAFGFRALAVLLLTYFNKYKLRTVYAIISRFAPSNENDTSAYVSAVASDLGVLPTAPINVEDPAILSSLCKSISIHEAGGWLFDSDDLTLGVSMALGQTPVPPDTQQGPLIA